MFEYDFDKYPKTHMPFAEYDDGRIREFGCVMVGGKWKVHELIDHEWVRVNTEMPEDATECSPFGWYDVDEQKFRLQYIGGASVFIMPFRLYELDDGAHEIVKAAVGCQWKGITVSGNGSCRFDIEKRDERLCVNIRDVRNIYRITHNVMNPTQILASVEDNGGNIRTLVYDFWRDRCYELLADGKPTYKPCIIGDVCAHALKCGDDFEDRRIVTTEDWEMTPVPHFADVEHERVVEED